MGSSPAEGAARARCVVLLGFMAAGKSAVGALLAERLGWAHVDLDREIERREGRRVAEIFAGEGEARFRALEAEVTAEVGRRTEIVLSPGGGWVTRPELRDLLHPLTLVVRLLVSPEEAVRRAAAAPGERPLLAGADPLAAARRLLAEREPLYAAAAGLSIETEGRAPAEVAEEIAGVVRGGLLGGNPRMLA